MLAVRKNINFSLFFSPQSTKQTVCSSHVKFINRTHIDAHENVHLPKSKKKPEQFRLHNDAIEKKSRVVNRISKIFPASTSTSASSSSSSAESESQRPDDNFLMQHNGFENGYVDLYFLLFLYCYFN